MATLLSIGATGSIGRHVVDAARSAGWDVRALVRDHRRGRRILGDGAELVTGSLESPKDIRRAPEGVDAVVLTHGTYTGDPHAVYYGAVEHLLGAVRDRRVRISLMTMIAVTDAEHSYGGNFEIVQAKRRSERLLRASGQTYTIVRPSWFGMAGPQQQRLEFLQGDTNISGGPADGVIGRAQIARVLVGALTSKPARSKTLELHAVDGERPEDLDPLVAALDPDTPGELDGAHDRDSQPLADEPESVRETLNQLRAG